MLPSHLIDLLPLVLLALLIFGPKRLPEMGASIGKTIKEFQKSMKEVTEPNSPTPTTAALPPAVPQANVPPMSVPAASLPQVIVTPEASAQIVPPQPQPAVTGETPKE